MVGVLGHAEHVRRGDPVHGVDVHREEPVVDRGGVNAGDQGEVADHHQPRDVMRPRVCDDLAQAVLHAVHCRLAGPEEVRQFALLTQAVATEITGALVKVNAADELSPTDDLPDETLDIVDCDTPLLESVDCRVNAFSWV